MSDIDGHPLAEGPARTHRGGLLLDVHSEGDSCVVHATGELDFATRNDLFDASTAGQHSAMVIDLAAVTFMDCAGYGSVVASRLAVEHGGGVLTIRGQTGQPARLLDLIASLEPIRPADD